MTSSKATRPMPALDRLNYYDHVLTGHCPKAPTGQERSAYMDVPLHPKPRNTSPVIPDPATRLRYHTTELEAWDATHAQQTLTMYAQYRREQDVLLAQL